MCNKDHTDVSSPLFRFFMPLEGRLSEANISRESSFLNVSTIFFPLQKIKEGEVDIILLCLKEKTKIKGKGGREKKRGETKGKWWEGSILFKYSQIWFMTLAHSTVCFSSKKQVLILATIFVRGPVWTLWKKFRNFERLTCCRGKQKERSFMDAEKIFEWKLDQNKQFEKENVFKPVWVRSEGFENMFQNRISRRSYTALWKVILVCTWPLCESDSFDLLKKFYYAEAKYFFLQQKLWTSKI